MTAARALEALDRLRAGNARFAAGALRGGSGAGPARRAAVVAEQRPFAAVLACADSRVPPELVFDAGLGDLFVVRVAGVVATPAEVASLEFAAFRLGVPLVVVMGHTGCGAVSAAVDAALGTAERAAGELPTLLGLLRPAVEAARSAVRAGDRAAWVREATRVQVRLVADGLRTGSPVLRRLGREAGLCVVGALYALETGQVEFFDGVPAAGSPRP